MVLNILIIDDSAIVRKVLTKTIKMAEVSVQEIYQAANGEEGLTQVAEHAVDLIFLDINMPTMNGMEFMRRLREMEGKAEIPVIVVSTEGSKDRRDELFALGIKAFMRKPITPEEFAEVVHQVLEEE